MKVPFARAVATSKLASSFVEAAACQPRVSDFSWFATLYLLGHALELAWKAVLIAEGTTERRLKKIGHDLRKARAGAERVVESSVPTTAEVGAVAEMLADYYGAKALEYIEPGFVSLPKSEPAIAAVKAYVQALRSWVEHRVRERLRRGDKPDDSPALDPAGAHGSLYRRLVLSQYDLQEAAGSHARLLALNEFDEDPLAQSSDTTAHLTQMVVAYVRPWSGNRPGDRRTKAEKRLPKELRSGFAEAESAMHERLILLRNQEFAHSDAEAAEVHITTVPPDTVTAVWRRTRLSFTSEEMTTIGECIRKLRAALVDEKKRIEPQIYAALRTPISR